MEFLNKLIAFLTGIFYKKIPTVYNLLYDIAGAEFFNSDAMQTLSTNLYIMMSVVMLFAFGVQLIKAIVNPELLFDNKKGTTAFLKRAVLSIVIITLVPIAFRELYDFQKIILDNNLVEKVVIGLDSSKSDANIGQYLAGVSIQDVLSINEGAESERGTAISETYDNMINVDINKYYDDVVDDINEKYTDSNGKKQRVFKYEPLFAILVSISIFYILFTSCMDLALRMVKMSFLQLIAPISIVSYVFKGADALTKWAQEVAKTYALVFIKIGALSFLTYALKYMPEFFNDETKEGRWILKLLVIIGLLTLVNELPNLIQTLFGVSFQFKGGIGGRLGNMFGPAGNIAKNAWNNITNVGKKAAGGFVLGAAALGAGGAGLAAATIATGVGVGVGKHAWNKGFGTGKPLKDTKVGRGLRVAGRSISAGVKDKGGIISAVNAGAKEGEKAATELYGNRKQVERAKAKNDAAYETITERLGVDKDSRNVKGLKELIHPTKVEGGNAEKLQAHEARVKHVEAANANLTSGIEGLSIPNSMKEILLGKKDANGNRTGGKVKADENQKAFESIKSSREGIKNGLNALASQFESTNPKITSKLKSLEQAYRTGQHKFEDKEYKNAGEMLAKVMAEISTEGNISGEVTKDQVLKYADQIKSTLSKDGVRDMINAQAALVGQTIDLDNIHDTPFNITATNVEKTAASYKEDYDKLVKSVENDPYLSRDIKYMETNIGRVQDSYFTELKGDKYQDDSVQNIFASELAQLQAAQTSSAQPQPQPGYGPTYYPNGYDDFYNNPQNSTQSARPEATGTGAPQSQPQPINNAGTQNIGDQGPQRVIEREIIREGNNQNGPTTLDNVTINANDINAQNLAAQNVNAQGFNANNNNNANSDLMSDRLKGQYDELFDQMADVISDAQKESSEDIVDAVNKLNNKNNNQNNNNQNNNE